MTARKLNVGCGRAVLDGWINLDSSQLDGVDVVADLEVCGSKPLPFEDDSIDSFLLSHVIEHIHNTLPMMAELWRIAKPGAIMTIRVPFGSSDDAWEDPTHVRAYFLRSFGYFSQPYYWRADYGYRGDWQTKHIHLTIDRRFEGQSVETITRAIRTSRNVVCEMIAELTAVKPIRLPSQALQVAPQLSISIEGMEAAS